MQGAMAHLRDDFSWRVYYIWGAKIFGTETRSQLTMSLLCTQQTSTPYTVRKEIKCSGDSEILREIARDTTRIKSCRSDFRVVSRPISFSISEFPLHFISFLTVCMSWIPTPHNLRSSSVLFSLYHSMIYTAKQIKTRTVVLQSRRRRRKYLVSPEP